MSTRTLVVTLVFVAAMGAVPVVGQEGRLCSFSAEVEIFRGEATLPEYEWSCKGAFGRQISGFGFLAVTQQGERSGNHFLDISPLASLPFFTVTAEENDNPQGVRVQVAPTVLVHKTPFVGRSTQTVFEGLRVSKSFIGTGKGNKAQTLIGYQTRQLKAIGVAVFSEGMFRPGNDQGEFHFWSSTSWMRQHRVWVGGVVEVENGSAAFKSGIRIVLKR